MYNGGGEVSSSNFPSLNEQEIKNDAKNITDELNRLSKVIVDLSQKNTNITEEYKSVEANFEKALNDFNNWLTENITSIRNNIDNQSEPIIKSIENLQMDLAALFSDNKNRISQIHNIQNKTKSSMDEFQVNMKQKLAETEASITEYKEHINSEKKTMEANNNSVIDKLDVIMVS